MERWLMLCCKFDKKIQSGGRPFIGQVVHGLSEGFKCFTLLETDITTEHRPGVKMAFHQFHLPIIDFQGRSTNTQMYNLSVYIWEVLMMGTTSVKTLIECLGIFHESYNTHPSSNPPAMLSMRIQASALLVKGLGVCSSSVCWKPYTWSEKPCYNCKW